MPLHFTTADERMARPPGIKMTILGPSGIGKTSLLWTLPAETTLFIDMEAGDLSVDGWAGLSIDVRSQAKLLGMTTWGFLQSLACWISGPNPAVGPDKTYSDAHYKWVCEQLGDPAQLDRIETVFFDSITVASRICFSWSQGQPDAFSEKTGKPDTRGAYGLAGREMVDFLTQLQHARGKSVIFVGIMDKVKDDYGRAEWQAQLTGAATGKALPGIVDQVISMVEIDFGEAGKHRAFVTQTLNADGYPAKDRSGQLDEIEEPHLGKVMEKIRAGGRARALAYGIPADAVPVAVEEPAQGGQTVEAATAPEGVAGDTSPAAGSSPAPVPGPLADPQAPSTAWATGDAPPASDDEEIPF